MTAAQTPLQAFEIVVFREGRLVGSQVFTRSPVTIGRSPRSSLRLDDPSLAPSQASVHFTGRSCLLEDVAGGPGGLRVGGNPTERHLVSPTDAVELGCFTLRFVFHQGEAEADAKEPAPEALDGPPTAEGRADFADDEPTTVAAASQFTEKPAPSDGRFGRTEPMPTIATDSPRAPAPGAAPVRAPHTVSRTPAQRTKRTGPAQPGAPRAQQSAPPTQRNAPRAQQSAPPAPKSSPAIDATRPISQPVAPAAPASHQPVPQVASPAPAPPESGFPPSAPRPAGVRSAQACQPTIRAAVLPAPVPPAARAEAQVMDGSRGLAAAAPAVPSSTGAASQLASGSRGGLASAAGMPGGMPSSQAAPAAAAWPGMPAARVPDDDDEDDDADFQPRFSLAGTIVDRSRAARPATAATATAVVMLCRGDRVIEAHYLGPKRKAHLGGRNGPLLRRVARGKLLLPFVFEQVPAISFNGAPVDPAGLRSGERGLEISPGMEVDARLSADERLHVHFAEPVARIGGGSLKLRMPRGGLSASAGALLVHVGVFLTLATSSESTADAVAVDLNEGRFAKIAMKDLALEPPPPPPEPVPEPEPPEPAAEVPAQPTAASLPDPTPQPARQARAARTPGPARGGSSSSGPAQPGPPAKSQEIASALSSALGTTGSASASATNLSIVNAGRATAGYKVSAPVGKIPGDGLVVPGGRNVGEVGAVRTRVAAELAAQGGDTVGKVTGGGGGGRVRGVVKGAPAGAVRVEGRLDRSQIQAVVNAHMSEVQGCYERALIKDRGLSGKLAMEWVITEGGSVGVVRIKSSSLKSADVTSCIQSSIRRWRFPSPQGGPVTVVYPFVFNTIGL